MRSPEHRAPGFRVYAIAGRVNASTPDGLRMTSTPPFRLSYTFALMDVLFFVTMEPAEDVRRSTAALLRSPFSPRCIIRSCGGGIPPAVSTRDLKALLETVRDAGRP